MDSIPADERLKSIAGDLQAGNQPQMPAVRDLLSWFGVQRRGHSNVRLIRQALKQAGLQTVPDFESAYIHAELQFVLHSENSGQEHQTPTEPSLPDRLVIRSEIVVEQSATDTSTASSEPDKSPEVILAYDDPSYRISKLEAANKSLRSVTPDATVKEAATIMLLNDFSQLPVMTSAREVKGIVTWASIGARLALGKKAEFVRDVMDTHHELRSTASIFQAIPIIVQHNCVLIRSSDSRISGIVTGSDLSLQFQKLSEPFVLLGEIENHIRGIIDSRFAKQELIEVRDPGDATRSIEDASDLSFGEYIRLLEHAERWSRLALPLDRVTFCNKLDSVRKIRNEVMHFDPDGISSESLIALRDFAAFLQRLRG